MKITNASFRSSTRTTGFTLVEVLVAVTVLTVVLYMVSTMFAMFNQTVNRALRDMETYEQVRSVATFIGRDISTAVVKTTHVNRNISFAVTASATNADIYFCYPEESINSLTNMSFLTHAGYHWDGGSGELYRSTYNTALNNALLMSTASSQNNVDTTADAARLQNMTLAYTSDAWYSTAQFQAAKTAARDFPVLRHVYGLDIRCYATNAPGPSASYSSNWSSTTTLPRTMQLIFRVANERDVPRFLADPTQVNILQEFVITVPMVNYGSYNNQIW